MTQALPFSLYPLDRNFVGPKPIEEAPHSVFYELEDKRDLIIERKRNGHASYPTIQGGKGGIHIYSRGINTLTAKIPAIVEELRAINFPKDTMIAGELFVQKNGVDDLGSFGRIARSGPLNAIEIQKTTPVHLALYNIVVAKGKPVLHLPYEDRLDMLQEFLARHAPNMVRVVEALPYTFDQAREEVKKGNWEGLVLYSKKAGSEFRTDGVKARPPRPYGCWKWKPYPEGDFVATGWNPSTSKTFKGLVKDIDIAQYDPVTHKLVPWGKVGVGLSTAQKKEFANDALYPMVFEIKFESRTPNKRLMHAQILRRRTDKSPEECYSPETAT